MRLVAVTLVVFCIYGCDGLSLPVLEWSRLYGNKDKRGQQTFEDLGPLASWGRVAPASEGVVNFLFMVKSGLAHPAVWRRFFAGAPKGTWQAFVHCSDPDGCEDTSLFADLGFHVVPQVNTLYCNDLVSAAVQLMKFALDSSIARPGATEKFALVSDSTLPVKPFATVHSVLTSYPESDFCFTPMEEWRSTIVDGVKVYLPKHSQWVTLNREHAKTLVSEWIPPEPWYTDRGWWNVPLKGGTWTGKQRKASAIRFRAKSNSKWMCADEFAVFAKIFGAFEPGPGESKSFPGLGNLSHTGQVAQNAQGRCRTFVVFRDTQSLGNLTESVEEEVMRDPALSSHIGVSHPLSLDHVGPRSLAALRRSDFLFARKFSCGEDEPQTGAGRQLVGDDYISLVETSL